MTLISAYVVVRLVIGSSNYLQRAFITFTILATNANVMILANASYSWSGGAPGLIVILFTTSIFKNVIRIFRFSKAPTLNGTYPSRSPGNSILPKLLIVSFVYALIVRRKRR